MNNEPVAWMLLGLEDRKPKLINLQVIEHLGGTWIPLYTHPANKKVEKNTDLYEKVCNCTKKLDLTDEEIALVWDKFSALPSPKDIKDFARAILRKAQEK